MNEQQQAQEKSIEELGASVLSTKRRYEAACARSVFGLEDSELIALNIERQRAVQAMVKAEMALSDACRKELA